MTNQSTLLVEALLRGRDLKVFENGVLYAIETIVSVADDGTVSRVYAVRKETGELLALLKSASEGANERGDDARAYSYYRALSRTKVALAYLDEALTYL